MSTGGASRKIGLIGLGLMGRPMGMNLLKAGHSLTVWNRTPSRADELVAAGAVLARTPREVAEASDVLLTIVSDPPALESVLWGQDGKLDGALAGLKAGSTYIDSSTVSPTLVKKISAACKERGVSFLDAPVTGGDWGAREGNLVFMIGGEAKALTEVEPILRVMGKKMVSSGPKRGGADDQAGDERNLGARGGSGSGSHWAGDEGWISGRATFGGAAIEHGALGIAGPENSADAERGLQTELSLAADAQGSGIGAGFANQLGVALPTTAAVREVYNYVKGRSERGPGLFRSHAVLKK